MAWARRVQFLAAGGDVLVHALHALFAQAVDLGDDLAVVQRHLERQSERFHQRSHLLDPVEVFVPSVDVYLEAGLHTAAHVEVVGSCVEVGNLPVDGRMADDMLHVPAPEQPFGTSVAPQ
jgi:hypothetical protein